MALACCGRIDFDPSSDARLGDARIADVPAVCGPLPCAGRATFLVCNGKCFAACEDSLGYSNALARCNQWGGTLATISSAADQPCVDQWIGAVPADVWIGYVQVTPALSPSVGWSWLDGTPTTGYTNWSNAGAIQPDDGDGTEDGDEQCGEIFAVDHARNDQSCATGSPIGLACTK